MEKLRLLDQFVDLYQSRVQIALEEYAPRFVKVAVCARCEARIVPDMDITYLDRDALLSAVDTSRSGIGGVMALFDRAPRDEVPFVLIFADGDALCKTVRVVLQS